MQLVCSFRLSCFPIVRHCGTHRQLLMNPIFICDGRLLNVPSSETFERALIRTGCRANLVISSAAVSDSAVRLGLRRTYGRRGYPSFPSDGCVRGDLYLPFIYFLLPTAGRFHVKPTTTQQIVRLSHIILIASSHHAHLYTLAEHSRKTEATSLRNSFSPLPAAAVIYLYVREHWY